MREPVADVPGEYPQAAVEQSPVAGVAFAAEEGEDEDDGERCEMEAGDEEEGGPFGVGALC